jgi:thiol:disulfide interchange protein DsbD
MQLRYLWLSILIGLPALLAGQMVKTPEFRYRFSKDQIKTGETVELIITADIPKNWHLFSEETDCPPDEGPIEASLTFSSPNGKGKAACFETVGKFSSVGDHLVRDDIFECSTGQFEGKAEFRQKLRILADDAVIEFRFQGQMCDDVSGMCVGVNPAPIRLQLPKVAGESLCAAASPETPAAPIDTPATAPGIDTTGPSVAVQGDTASATPSYRTNSSSDIGNCKPKTFAGSLPAHEKGLWTLFLLAFLSGLVGLITPCVFPMIPMTVTFFMKNKSKAAAFREAFIFAFSIIAIYTLLGTMVAAIFGPEAGNWVSTHWAPNLFFFIIFIVFAASFFGAFELVLPAGLVNKVDSQADKGGWMGPVFMAMTIALVSFSCTGPIVGTVLAQSITGDFLTPVVGMFGFSLAFALPFGIFALFPKLLQSLPKGGGWLNSVKVVLGFIELAFALKFLSVADQTYHWGILDREIYLALWIAIFSLMGLYLIGKIKFSHDSDLPYLGVGRLTLAVATFAFVAYLVPGMWGAPLKGLAGYLPPLHTQDFDMNRSIREAQGITGNVCGKPRYSDQLHLPHGLAGYFDYEEALACSKELKKPVFIDFTGHGCVNCRKMEEKVWSDPRVLKLLREEYVIASLYVDDHKIELPPSEQFTSRYTGQKVTGLGQKNTDLQICYFGANVQPLYVLMDGRENMLQPAASAETFSYDATRFAEFLEAGIKQYKSQNQNQ